MGGTPARASAEAEKRDDGVGPPARGVRVKDGARRGEGEGGAGAGARG